VEGYGNYQMGTWVPIQNLDVYPGRFKNKLTALCSTNKISVKNLLKF